MLDQMSELKNTAFVVCCRTGVRSNQAQKYLMKNGFSKVINLTGGLEGYLADR
jgi:rhodanese-related sulfurtransferase